MLKGVLIFVGGGLVFMALVVVAIFFLISWTADHDEQENLTDSVTARIVDTKRDTRGSGTDYEKGHEVSYTYDHGGRIWADTEFLSDKAWAPGQPLTICVKPDDSAVHTAIHARPSTCGEVVSGGVRTAEPTTSAG